MRSTDLAQYALISVGVGLILFLLILITLTYLFSFLVLKIDRPKFKRVIAIAFFQVLLGILTIVLLRVSTYDSLFILLYALAVLLVSGLFLVKLFLNYSWKQTLSIWAVAGGIQVVVVPICSVILAIISTMILMHLFPP